MVMDLQASLHDPSTFPIFLFPEIISRPCDLFLSEELIAINAHVNADHRYYPTPECSQTPLVNIQILPRASNINQKDGYRDQGKPSHTIPKYLYISDQ
ncbi:hypothetical protein EYC84_000913 [Monilinia fructicola]|uniref:Uncharacterized protein n=1 Tax=Monilinia fructicola TaxID=38448 RepID=A0A5M9JMN5_MONFR|nr:hypothetical protein EYC84_000913 [Monilinia fructicola]